MSEPGLSSPLPRWLRLLPAVYLLLGLAWIVGSDVILGRLLSHDLERLVHAGTLKGALFVILSAALLYIAIATSQGTRAQLARVMPPMAPGKPLAAFLLVGLCIAAAGYVVYRFEVAELHDHSEAHLAVAAKTTADEIAMWREARIASITQVAASPVTGALLANWRRTGSERSTELLTEHLSSTKNSNNFDSTVIVDADGQALFTVGGALDTSTQQMRAAIRRSIDSDRMVELVPNKALEPPSIPEQTVFVVPLPDRESQVPGSAGALVASARIDSVLRKIQPSDPAGFESLSSSIVRRVDATRLPIDGADTLGARALSTDGAAFLAVDSRGRTVLAVSRAVDGTPYFAVATIDLAELKQQTRRVTLLIGGMSALGFFATFALVLPWWLVERARTRVLLEHEHTRAEELATRLNWVTRHANDVILLLDDDDGTIIDANDRAEQLYGYSRQELLSMTVTQLRLSDPAERAAARYQIAAVRDRGSILFETIHRLKNGTTVPVEVSARSVTLGKKRYVQSIVRDISQRREIEQRLRESEAQYRLLFQSNPHPMWVYDPQSLRFLEVNDAAIAHYGFSRREFLAMTIADIRPPEDVPRMVADVLERASKALQYSGLWRHRRKDGSVLSVEIASHFLKFDGRAARLVLATDVTARMRAEEALRASEERYRNLFEHANDGVLVCDAHNRILDANAELEVMTGYSREELQGTSLRDMLDAQEQARLIEYPDAPPDGSLPGPGPWIHRRKDGTNFPGEVRVRNLPDGVLLATVRDLTEILSARRHIERQRDLYDLLSQCNQAIVQVGDRVGLFDRLCQLAVERGRFLAACVSEIGPDDTIVPVALFGDDPDCRAAAIAVIEAVRTGQPVIINDSQQDPRCGGREDTQSSCAARAMAAFPLRTRSGIAMALTLYGRDSGEFDAEISATLQEMAANISHALDALQTRRALDENQLLLQSMIDTSDAVIYAFDTEGRAILMNEAGAHALGSIRATSIGRTRQEMMPAEIAEIHAANDQQVIRKGAPLFFEERNVQSGVERTYLSVKSPLRDVGGRIYAVGGISTDITELRRIQQELAETNVRLEEKVVERTGEAVAARERAEAADRAKSLFLSSMSHELRSPLHSIIGFTSVLLEGLEGELTSAQHEHLRVVADASQHLLAIINDLLDMSRIEASAVSLESSTVSVRRLLTRIMRRFRLQAESKGLEFDLVEETGDFTIVGDERRIEQIVSNFVANAIKYTAQGRVLLTSRIDGSNLRIEVSDTGPGIRTEDQTRLFKYFSQVAPTGGRLNEGTGLGLAIARGLAEALGGHVSLDSEPGRGSVFIFMLPIHPNEGSLQ